MASTVFIGWSTFLKSQMRCRSLDPRSSSSFLVPDLLMSIAGKILFSASFLSRYISQLPVPLNSSR